MIKRSAMEISGILREWSGDPGGGWDDALLELVYDELRRQAHQYLRRERAGHTLQTTALVHEAYIKLAGQRKVEWQNRAHFFAMASTMMRRILIDHAKTKHRLRRGGVHDDVPLDAALMIGVDGTDLDLIALDQALDRLAAKDAHLTKVVELRFFSGLNVEETASVLGVSESTIKRDWQMAKAWLHRELAG